MAIQNIRIPSLLGGKTTVSQSQRLPIELERLDNCDGQTTRGMDKRPGTNHIASDGTTESLNIVGAGNVMHIFWINRSATERFVGFIDPAAASDLNVIQIWNIVTGDESSVLALDSDGTTESALNDADADIAEMLVYLKAGSSSARQRFRTLSVEDATFVLNRTVATALEGTAITYRDAGTDKIRKQSDSNNVISWSDFDQPPTSTSSFPTRATLLAGGNIDSDSIWHAREDDVGLPMGFYHATSATQPPWYQRLPTEPSNGYPKRDTMPLRIDWNGTRFLLQFVEWEPRKSGDGTTNPGPTFIGNALDDISFHQGRLWFAAGERMVSSRAGDIFNLWIDSTGLITDADPIDTSIQGRRISNIRILESFRESLIGITDGARQMELRANGPITPQSFQIYDSTNVFSANYVKPTVMGSNLLFAGERDFSMVVWEYNYSPTQVNNVATDITERVHGYIPAEAHLFAASEAHDQMFILTLADTDAVYVNKSIFQGADKVLNSWYRWVYPDVTSVESVSVFDDFLYMVNERSDGLWYLERQALGQPAQDVVGAQTMNYSVRMDRKVEIQGVYNVGTNQTAFTLPWVITGDLHIVAGPTFDTTSVKAAGTEIPLLSMSGSPSVLLVTGDWENNADGTNAPCYVGNQYVAEAELSEPFVRDDSGLALSGNTHMMRMKVRHRDSGGYSVLITPEGRSQDTITYVPPTVGSSPIDGDQLDDFGEFQVKVMCHARNATIILSNDTPYPTAWVDLEIDADFIPQSYSPVR